MAIKKNRMQSNEERNNKIEQMGLDELKQYLCMKNYQNPERCKDCPGVKTCKAGQRATLLLNEREVQQMTENSGRKGKTPEQMREIARKKFIVAAAQDDPIEYVMKMDGNSRNAAREKLKSWANKFPDITEQYDFWHKNTLDAIERFKEALAQKDPIAFVMEKYGWDRKKASHNFYQWKSRYGTVKEEPKMEQDEVSVEEFLKEVSTEVEEAVGTVQAEEIVEKANETADCTVEQPPVIATDKNFFGELFGKYSELMEERNALYERIAWIDKAIDALVTTAKVFEPDKELGYIT